MSATPQSNATLEQIAEVLRASDDVVICGHAGPDGDCIGSQLALQLVLESLGKRVTCVLVKDEPLDLTTRYLPGVDRMVAASKYSGPVGTFVAVDVPTRDRMGEAAVKLQSEAGNTVTIDHHAVDTCMARYSYTDPDCAATTILIWEIAGMLGCQDVPGVAQCAYHGVVTDTGSFRNTNTDLQAFTAATQMVAAGADVALSAREVYQNRTAESLALESIVISHMSMGAEGRFALSWLCVHDFERTKATKPDADMMADLLRSLSGVEVACILREQGDHVRGSFRAKGNVDVAAIARRYDGGGHQAAAGFTLHESITSAADHMYKVLTDEFAALDAAHDAGGEGGEGGDQAHGD